MRSNCSICAEIQTEWKQLSAWVLWEVLSEILDWETQVSLGSLYKLSNRQWTLTCPRLIFSPDQGGLSQFRYPSKEDGKGRHLGAAQDDPQLPIHTWHAFASIQVLLSTGTIVLLMGMWCEPPLCTAQVAVLLVLVLVLSDGSVIRVYIQCVCARG